VSRSTEDFAFWLKEYNEDRTSASIKSNVIYGWAEHPYPGGKQCEAKVNTSMIVEDSEGRKALIN